MINIIVAIDARGAIGRGGDLLFHRREDMRHFREITMGNTLVMGRKTFESLPGGALPGRRNIVVTRSDTFSAPETETAHTIDEALAMAATGPGDIYIIGGGEIYRQTLPLAKRLHLTVFDKAAPDADTFFPAIPLDNYSVENIDRRDDFAFVTLACKEK